MALQIMKEKSRQKASLLITAVLCTSEKISHLFFFQVPNLQPMTIEVHNWINLPHQSNVGPVALVGLDGKALSYDMGSPELNAVNKQSYPTAALISAPVVAAVVLIAIAGYVVHRYRKQQQQQGSYYSSTMSSKLLSSSSSLPFSSKRFHSYKPFSLFSSSSSPADNLPSHTAFVGLPVWENGQWRMVRPGEEAAEYSAVKDSPDGSMFMDVNYEKEKQASTSESTLISLVPDSAASPPPLVSLADASHTSVSSQVSNSSNISSFLPFSRRTPSLNTPSLISVADDTDSPTAVVLGSDSGSSSQSTFHEDAPDSTSVFSSSPASMMKEFGAAGSTDAMTGSESNHSTLSTSSSTVYDSESTSIANDSVAQKSEDVYAHDAAAMPIPYRYSILTGLVGQAPLTDKNI